MIKSHERFHLRLFDMENQYCFQRAAHQQLIQPYNELLSMIEQTLKDWLFEFRKIFARNPMALAIG